MILLFTDFGSAGPYLGEMEAVLCDAAPNERVINLFADLPAHNICASAYLIESYSRGYPPGTVFLCIVDPGVGTTQRRPVIVNADGCYFVGPDNGLLDIVIRRAEAIQISEIIWRPQSLTASFHGRDLFAPVAAALATQSLDPGYIQAMDTPPHDVPPELAEVIYIDHFGNAITGTRASTLGPADQIEVRGHWLERATTFGSVVPGTAFYYENSRGLIELAVNQGRACDVLRLNVGTGFTIQQRG